MAPPIHPLPLFCQAPTPHPARIDAEEEHRVAAAAPVLPPIAGVAPPVLEREGAFSQLAEDIVLLKGFGECVSNYKKTAPWPKRLTSAGNAAPFVGAGAGATLEGVGAIPGLMLGLRVKRILDGAATTMAVIHCSVGGFLNKRAFQEHLEHLGQDGEIGGLPAAYLANRSRKLFEDMTLERPQLKRHIRDRLLGARDPAARPEERIRAALREFRAALPGPMGATQLYFQRIADLIAARGGELLRVWNQLQERYADVKRIDLVLNRTNQSAAHQPLADTLQELYEKVADLQWTKDGIPRVGTSRRTRIEYAQAQRRLTEADEGGRIEARGAWEIAERNYQAARETKELVYGMGSVFQSVGSLVGTLGNPKLGNQLNAVGSGAVALYEGMSSLSSSAGLLGTKFTIAALAGTLGSITSVFGALGGIAAAFGRPQQTAMARIMKQLRAIATQIQQLRGEMHGRFDRIESSLGTIYRDMLSGFNALATQAELNQDAVMGALTAMERTLGSKITLLLAETGAFHEAALTADLGRIETNLISYREGEIPESDTVLTGDLRGLYLISRNTAYSPVLTGRDTPLGAEGWFEALGGGALLPYQKIDLFRRYLRESGFEIPDSPLPSPAIFARSLRAYLDYRQEFASHIETLNTNERTVWLPAFQETGAQLLRFFRLIQQQAIVPRLVLRLQRSCEHLKQTCQELVPRATQQVERAIERGALQRENQAREFRAEFRRLIQQETQPGRPIHGAAIQIARELKLIGIYTRLGYGDYCETHYLLRSHLAHLDHWSTEEAILKLFRAYNPETQSPSQMLAFFEEQAIQPLFESENSFMGYISHSQLVEGVPEEARGQLIRRLCEQEVLKEHYKVLQPRLELAELREGVRALPPAAVDTDIWIRHRREELAEATTLIDFSRRRFIHADIVAQAVGANEAADEGRWVVNQERLEPYRRDPSVQVVYLFNEDRLGELRGNAEFERILTNLELLLTPSVLQDTTYGPLTEVMRSLEVFRELQKEDAEFERIPFPEEVGALIAAPRAR